MIVSRGRQAGRAKFCLKVSLSNSPSQRASTSVATPFPIILTKALNILRNGRSRESTPCLQREWLESQTVCHERDERCTLHAAGALGSKHRYGENGELLGQSQMGISGLRYE